MDELWTKVLLEGGSLAIFVAFVIWMARSQAAERAAWLKAITDASERRDQSAQGNMSIGLSALDKTNGSIKELTIQTVELTKAIAVHDVRSTEQQDHVQDGITLIIGRLDVIKDHLAAK